MRKIIMAYSGLLVASLFLLGLNIGFLLYDSSLSVLVSVKMSITTNKMPR